MIQFDRVSKRYPTGYDALGAVSFSLNAGEMAFVTGHSGAGKSTLLKLILRRETPSGGQIVVNNINLGKMRAARLPFYRRQIGMIYQDNKLLADRSVFDNVALPLVIAGVAPRERQRRVQAALDKVGLLNRAQQRPVALSGGEQQRVGIARAVVNRPPILLADEPTGNLDMAMSDDIMNLFAEFNHYGVTVLIATHDLRHIERLRKRVLNLQRGQLIGDSAAAPAAP